MSSRVKKVSQQETLPNPSVFVGSPAANERKKSTAVLFRIMRMRRNNNPLWVLSVSVGTAEGTGKGFAVKALRCGDFHRKYYPCLDLQKGGAVFKASALIFEAKQHLPYPRCCFTENCRRQQEQILHSPILSGIFTLAI